MWSLALLSIIWGSYLVTLSCTQASECVCPHAHVDPKTVGKLDATCLRQLNFSTKEIQQEKMWSCDYALLWFPAVSVGLHTLLPTLPVCLSWAPTPFIRDKSSSRLSKLSGLIKKENMGQNRYVNSESTRWCICILKPCWWSAAWTASLYCLSEVAESGGGNVAWKIGIIRIKSTEHVVH